MMVRRDDNEEGSEKTLEFGDDLIDEVTAKMLAYQAELFDAASQTSKLPKRE